MPLNKLGLIFQLNIVKVFSHVLINLHLLLLRPFIPLYFHL